MKNVIISVMGAYIFYGFCDVRSLLIPVAMFACIYVILLAIDEEISDFRKSVKRGQRLNNRINDVKRGTKGCY